MKPDAGLKPTRDVRTQISREHGNEPRRLAEYYMDFQRRFSHRLRWSTRGGPDGATSGHPDDAADLPPTER